MDGPSATSTMTSNDLDYDPTSLILLSNDDVTGDGSTESGVTTLSPDQLVYENLTLFPYTLTDSKCDSISGLTCDDFIFKNSSFEALIPTSSSIATEVTSNEPTSITSTSATTTSTSTSTPTLVEISATSSTSSVPTSTSTKSDNDLINIGLSPSTYATSQNYLASSSSDVTILSPSVISTNNESVQSNSPLSLSAKINRTCYSPLVVSNMSNNMTLGQYGHHHHGNKVTMSHPYSRPSSSSSSSPANHVYYQYQHQPNQQQTTQHHDYHAWNNGNGNGTATGSAGVSYHHGVWPSYCPQYCQVHGMHVYPYYNPYIRCTRSGQQVYIPPNTAIVPYDLIKTNQQLHQQQQLSVKRRRKEITPTPTVFVNNKGDAEIFFEKEESNGNQDNKQIIDNLTFETLHHPHQQQQQQQLYQQQRHQHHHYSHETLIPNSGSSSSGLNGTTFQNAVNMISAASSGSTSTSSSSSLLVPNLASYHELSSEHLDDSHIPYVAEYELQADVITDAELKDKILASRDRPKKKRGRKSKKYNNQ